MKSLLTTLLAWTLSFSLLASLSSTLSAQVVEQSPWTVRQIADGVYNIQDYTADNPRGFHLDAAGNRVGMNNSSDSYLVVGSERALLIDLSNPHDEAAAEALRELVYARIAGLPLTITATHVHGDHLGMLPAFANSPRTNYWVSSGEFRARDIFPADYTTWFDADATLDLGGRTVQSLPLPGHTPHSTGFLLTDANLLFTGDALGSGSGVWLFDYESLLVYRSTVTALLARIDSPAATIDAAALRIHGGHSWQYGTRSELAIDYVRDMQTLIERMATGSVEPQEYRVNIPFLDATFTYGGATITWNRAAAERLAASKAAE